MPSETFDESGSVLTLSRLCAGARDVVACDAAFKFKMDPEKFQHELHRARRHLEFVVKLYRKQLEAGRGLYP